MGGRTGWVVGLEREGGRVGGTKGETDRERERESDRDRESELVISV